MTSQVSPHLGLKCDSTRNLTDAFPLRGKRPRFTLEGGLQSPMNGQRLIFPSQKHNSAQLPCPEQIRSHVVTLYYSMFTQIANGFDFLMILLHKEIT